VKLYSMKAAWIGDDNVFKYLRPKEPEKWGGETLERQKRGEPLNMVWASDSEGKNVSDFIMFPGAGLASQLNLLLQLKKYAPRSQINSILIDSDPSPYGLLQVANYDRSDMQLPHIFMMFKQHKAMLVTELLKNEWDRRGLTGAAFVEVAEMDDDRFIKIASN
jgi:hypothetical protein